MVPGIRPLGHVSPQDDQSRVMTPSEALELGADHLVVGRPVTQAEDVKKAAAEIATSISSCNAAA